MTRQDTDARLRRPTWSAARPTERHRARVRLLTSAALTLAGFYFLWLLHPDRAGHPVLYGLLVAAEVFNVAQAIGFWWTCSRDRARPRLSLDGARAVDVDVFIPTYDEPEEVVAPTVAAACRLRGARVHVHLLDDGVREGMREVAERHGARYVTREPRTGAKAGNVNHALALSASPFVAVLDCDHLPQPDFLEATLGHLADDRVAFVQTPQYYANSGDTDVASAAWSQQALFFGAIARGKDGHDAMFCCGTNVVFRRAALESIGGFPERSVTEDFELSIRLHEQGWRTAYVPDVLARGLGPEDMASYVSQQQRWARGCLSALPAILRARLPRRQKLQYLLSSTFFLTGWTVLVYMTFPVVRILTGAQPLEVASADEFLVHFAPYFGLALVSVAIAGAGDYSFRAYALQVASFWIHVQATLLTLLRRRGRFVVTPKQGTAQRQPRAVLPALVAAAVLVGVSVWGLAQDRSPATLNNVAFALMHVTVLVSGAMPALRPARRAGGRTVDSRREAPAAA